MLSKEVEDCIIDAEKIRDVENLAYHQDRAMLHCYGLTDSSDEDLSVECSVAETEGLVEKEVFCSYVPGTSPRSPVIDVSASSFKIQLA